MAETSQYTDIQEQFLNHLKRYPIKNVETIVDYVSSQGEGILEDPERLAEALAECEISPVRRRQVLKHWFAEKGVGVPEGILRKATTSPEAREKEEEKEKEGRSKYSVDPETGTIRVASGQEKALSWDEAQDLSKHIKRERGTPPEGGKEPAFIQDRDGNWVINPKAKVSGETLLAYEAYRKMVEKGEPADPFDVLAEQATRWRVLQETFGGGKQELTMTDMVGALKDLQEIIGPGRDIAEIRASIKELKEGTGKPPQESEDVKALRKEIGDLRAEVAKKEREALEGQISALRTELSSLKGEMARLGEGAKATSEYGIMSQALNIIDKRAASMEAVVKGVFGRPPAPLSPEEREALGKGLERSIQEDLELDALGARLLSGRPPA